MRSDCLTGEGTVTCRGNEILVAAHCGPARNPATFVGRRQASCSIEINAANAPLVAACIMAPP